MQLARCIPDVRGWLRGVPGEPDGIQYKHEEVTECAGTGSEGSVRVWGEVSVSYNSLVD